MSTWNTDDPNIGSIHQAGAAFSFNNALYYFGTNDHKHAFFAGMETSSLDQSNATIPIPSKTYWSSIDAEISSAKIDANGAVAAAVLPAAAASPSSSVYTFWRDSSNGVMAANWTSASLKLPFNASNPVSNDGSFVLQDSGGNKIQALADVAASTIDANNILVGAVTKAGVYIAIFSPSATSSAPSAADDSSSPTPWKAMATAEWTISLEQLQSLGPAPTSTGSNLSLEWYSINGTSFWLAFSLFDGKMAYIYWLPFDIISLPYAALGYVPGAASTPPGLATAFISATPVSITRDVAGRLCFYWASGGVLNTIMQPLSEPSTDAFTGNSYTLLDNKGNPFKAINHAPTGVFVQSPQSLPAQITNDPNIGGDTSLPAFPAAQVVIADDKGDFRIMSSPYGLLQQLNNQPAAQVSGQDYLVLRGIIDGPIPIPNENTMPYTFGGGYPSDCGEITYGSNQTVSTSSSWNYNTTAGVKSTGGPTKGVGPAWDISLSAGTGGGHGTTVSSQMLDNAVQPAELTTKLQKVTPLGTLVGYGIQIQYNLFRLLQPIANSPGYFEVDPNAPQFIQLMPFYSGTAATPFIPYDVTPGELKSYTREAWNARMQALGYPGPTYFEDVVLANAITFENGNQYLDFSWSHGSETSSSFNTSKEKFVDSSWQLTISVWAGFGIGEEVDFFGFGEGMEGQFLTGVTFDMTHSTQSSQEQGWGITLDQYWCPPPPKKGPGIESYGWRLYFLPSSSQWMEEFLKYRALAPNDGGLENPGLEVFIDPTSKPWRIVYEVVTYQPTAGQPYPASDKSGAPTPPAPVMKNWAWDLPANQGIWKPGNTVQYAVSFVSGEVESNLSAWSDPVTIQEYMCPELSLPVDATGWASARKVYRQFGDGTAEVVGVISDNSTTIWYDQSPQWNIPAPPALGAPDSTNWAQRSNTNNTQVFIPNQTVQYALTFVFEAGETQLGQWSELITITWWALPEFNNVPVFPNQNAPGFPQCIGRNLYRQCFDQNGNVVQKPTLVAQLNDNTTTSVRDQMY